METISIERIEMADFTIRAIVPAPYEATVARLRTLLADAGFGVLTEIDIQATLRAKLNVDVAPQIILGACRPLLAHAALQADPRMAALLPCNVVIAAEDDGRTRVEILDPAVMTSFSDAAEVHEVASEARRRLDGMMRILIGGASDAEPDRT